MSIHPRRLKRIALVSALVIAGVTPAFAQGSLTLHTPTAGDASFSWNSKTTAYDAYATGENSVGIYLTMGGAYGNDRTIGIFEVPIAPLAGGTLFSATLHVTSAGFGTNYYYGSAALGWLDTGATALTGDVVADNLGPLAKSLPGHWTIYDSGGTPSGAPGAIAFDVTTQLGYDLLAGRSYSTFVLSGSRETYGSILSAESGIELGPHIVALSSAIPEPAHVSLLTAVACLAGLLWRRFGRGARA